MSEGLIVALVITWLVLGLGSWLAWQLLRQNGRILLRLEELEQRLEELESGEAAGPGGPVNGEATGETDAGSQPDAVALGPSGNAQNPAGRFGSRSLARSRIKRDGLKAGTAAPSFRLPRLDGGELSLEELRGKRALLVFSDPHCGPCNALAPHLEGFHRENPDTSVVVISRGEPRENRAKVKEHGWTFPVVLQQRWEISRRYAMFATPIAYLIDEAGVIVTDVAIGVQPVQALLARAASRASELEMAEG